MGAEKILSKPSKWFSNKALRLSLGRRRSKSSSTLSPLRSPSQKEDELREVFRYFDGNGDGKISALELRSYFGSTGEYMSHEDAQGVIDDLDMDGDKLLDFEDFMRLMKREESGDGQDSHGHSHGHDSHGHSHGHDGHDEDLKMAFEMFELEKGSGCITPKGLQRMLNKLGDAKSYDECVAMIQVFDIDGNGVLDYHEFHQMMA